MTMLCHWNMAMIQTKLMGVTARQGKPTTGEASMRTLLSAGVLALSLTAAAQAAPDWKRVEQVFGRQATEQPGGIRRFSFPRSDLKVMLDGVTIRPALALGSWLAFHPMGSDEAVVMGDLVLNEQELNPVMKVLAEGGIDVTAIHNHLLRAQPATMYMHVQGHGDPTRLAEVLRAALERSGTPLTPPPGGGSSQQEAGLDTATLERTLGHQGKASGGVYQFSIPRAEPIAERGMGVPPSMGTGIVINFQPAGEGKTATTGDFVLTAEEVNPVLRTLREHGIEVTALHNHTRTSGFQRSWRRSFPGEGALEPE
jgi:hypothetical protein